MGIYDESYSSVDLSKILGVHRVTVTNWIKKGALNAARTPGGRYKVTKEDLRHFLSEQGMPIPPFLQIETKKLVVAVDDDNAILNILKKVFSTGDMPYLYQLKTFNNPLDAAFFIGDSKPDLVLLDLLMPQLNGFDLAGRIKQASPDTRIVVITGYETEENIKRLKQYSIEAILSKPFDLTELKRTIEATLMTKV
ncbi:MAG: response regulator [Deltaproteobacteria bacterium]|nr:response regulator [Deltaproteobacteria bacterium]